MYTPVLWGKGQKLTKNPVHCEAGLASNSLFNIQVYYWLCEWKKELQIIPTDFYNTTEVSDRRI